MLRKDANANLTVSFGRIKCTQLSKNLITIFCCCNNNFFLEKWNQLVTVLSPHQTLFFVLSKEKQIRPLKKKDQEHFMGNSGKKNYLDWNQMLWIVLFK